MTKFHKKLAQLEEKARYRTLNLPQGIDLSSNDYLGLREHPAMRAAAIEAFENGLEIGSGASRLLRASAQAHESLESFAAGFFGFEAALFFPCGFQANYALFSTLPDRHDVILFDAHIHASAKDGIHASHAKSVKVAHNDLNAYKDALKRFRDIKGQIWIAVDSIYSMDGDLAPLQEMQNLAKRYDAVLVVDEAHAVGVFGPQGKGRTEGLKRENLITMYACGKALGVAGGLVCASADIISYLINAARPFVYSTAPMPIQAVLVQKALELVRDDPEPRNKLMALKEEAHRLLPVSASASQIIPIILGEDSRAVFVAEQLQKAGFDIRAVRPPTVPEGTARLRLSLNSKLDLQTLRNFTRHLEPFFKARAL